MTIRFNCKNMVKQIHHILQWLCYSRVTIYAIPATIATLKRASQVLLLQKVTLGKLSISTEAQPHSLFSAIRSPPLARGLLFGTQEKRRLPKTIILQKSVYTNADCLNRTYSGTLRNSFVIIPFLEKRLTNNLLLYKIKLTKTVLFNMNNFQVNLI